jgi:hypothetical protein
VNREGHEFPRDAMSFQRSVRLYAAEECFPNDQRTSGAKAGRIRDDLVARPKSCPFQIADSLRRLMKSILAIQHDLTEHPALLHLGKACAELYGVVSV